MTEPTKEELEDMPEVDFSNSIQNPYAGKLRRRVTMNIDSSTIDYFKRESELVGVPYQTIINMYLGQCVKENKHLQFV